MLRLMLWVLLHKVIFVGLGLVWLGLVVMFRRTMLSRVIFRSTMLCRVGLRRVRLSRGQGLSAK